MKIHCCKCEKEVDARLTNGMAVYPRRPDLYRKPFWICDTCKNFVGCHPNTTKPLGVIATQEIRRLRMLIHSRLDPIWKQGLFKRKALYREISRRVGFKFHASSITSKQQAKDVLAAIDSIRKDTLCTQNQ